MAFLGGFIKNAWPVFCFIVGRLLSLARDFAFSGEIAFFAVFIISSILWKKVAMVVTVLNFFGVNPTRSDSKLNFYRILVKAGLLKIDLTTTPHRPLIDSTSTPHRPYIDPSSTPHRTLINPTSIPRRHHIDPSSITHRPSSTSHRTLIEPTPTRHRPHIDLILHQDWQ